MNQFAKRLAYGVSAALPDGVRWAVARAVVEDRAFGERHGLALIAALSRHCGVNGIRVSGAYGDVTGSPADAIIFRQYARMGTWAASTNAILAEFFDRRGDGTYLDVGANIGLTTVPLAQRPSVQCVAIEPEPENFRNLSANVAANCRNNNVTLWQRAVFDKPAVLTFELSPDNLGDHRVRSGAAAGAASRERESERKLINVQAETLDALAPATYGPLAIKIDTQGAEPFVVSGGARTLAAADILIMEFAPYLMRRLGGDPRIVLDMLRRDFSVARISAAEDCAEGAEQPIALVCEQLERLLDATGNPLAYVDVIARKL